MTRRSWVALIIGVVSIACAAGAFETRRGRPLIVERTVGDTEQIAIAGAVVDLDTDRPIAGALVVLHCECLQGQREAETTADGAFRFADLPPGTYTVQVLYRNADVSNIVTLERGELVKLRHAISQDEVEPIVT